MRKLSTRTWDRLKLLAGLLAVAGFVFLLPSRITAPARVLFNEAVGPLEEAAFQAGGQAVAAGGTLTEMFLKKDRERALAREVVRLRNENTRLADSLRRQDLRLRSVAKLEAREFPVRAVAAPVSSYDLSGMRRSIAVRAGTRDGVRPGMAVTADGGLVGVVSEAGPSQSRVRLITDPGSAVPCRVSRTRELCILQGTGGETCAVDWLEHKSFVEAGDVLVTASLDVPVRGELRLPDGVPAATARSVSADGMRPLFLAIEAVPRVGLDRLEGVEVLIPEQEGGDE